MNNRGSSGEIAFEASAADRKEAYELLCDQLQELMAGESDLVANLANTAAALKAAFGFFWVGFYLVKEGELVLGPFQGPVACTRIPFTRGVCGACYTRRETIVVPDVTLFPGHIACSSASRSEIVVPVYHRNGSVAMVLDIDSDRLDAFEETDRAGLERLVRLLERKL